MIGIMAAAETGGADPISLLLRYGVLGIMLVLFLVGLVYTKPTVDRLTKERDEERMYNKELEKELRSEIIPLMRDIQHATAEAVKANTEAIKELAAFRTWKDMKR